MATIETLYGPAMRTQGTYQDSGWRHHWRVLPGRGAVLLVYNVLTGQIGYYYGHI